MDIFSNKLGSCILNVMMAVGIALMWSLGVSWLAWMLISLLVVAVMTTYFISTKMPKIVDGKISKFVDINDEESPVSTLMQVASKSKATKESLNFDAVAGVICAVLLFGFVTSNVLFFCLQLALITFGYLANETICKYAEVIKANGGLDKSFATPKTPVSDFAEETETTSAVEGDKPEPEESKKEKGE